MESTPKEILKAYVDSQKFNSTSEIMDAMKEMFRDVLQQVMESELEAEPGCEKSQRTSEHAVENKPKNYRNGYPKKTVKTQLGMVDGKVPRDRNGEYEPQTIGKYNRNADGMEEKVRLRDESAEHLAGAGEQDQRKDHAGSHSVAKPAYGGSVSVRISGRHQIWLNVLNDLKNRGVLDVYLFCVDDLEDISVWELLNIFP